MIKAIETVYKGYRFRSRLEARWAVFFDACGVDWEYEPEGFDLGDGLWYLPDFLLHGVTFNHILYRKGQDLFVEVKGAMTEEDALKIGRFSGIDDWYHILCEGVKIENPILVVGNIPNGLSAVEIRQDSYRHAYSSPKHHVEQYNFCTIDGDYFSAFPGIDKHGTFSLFGDKYDYLMDQDDDRTVAAYALARQARFEHGETPLVNAARASRV